MFTSIVTPYTVDTVITKNHGLHLDNVPYAEGEHVTVVIVPHPTVPSTAPASGSLHGTVTQFLGPTAPVDPDAWSAAQ